METSKLKEYLKEEFPVVYKTAKIWLIKDSTNNILAGEMIRDRLEKKGFRKITMDENIHESLEEAEEYFSEETSK